jgi:hypothetical protein
MFGRRKEPFGAPPSAPPPPGGKEPFPIDKMDHALEAAIRLFTRALDDAGVDAGGLALRGAVPADVGALVAGCTTYCNSDDGILTYLALGITPDFKSFSYPPHCRLYFILNSVGICEDPAAAAILRDLAPHQLPGPLVDAHFMRCWIRFILPTAEAMRGGRDALEAMMRSMIDDLVEVARQVPRPFAERIDLQALLREWTSGFPGTIGRPLDDSVPRMNGLPVTPFIEEILMTELARLQADGLRQQRG